MCTKFYLKKKDALILKGDNGQTTYSTYFTITGAAPGTSNRTSVTAAAAATTGASSSASASAPSSKTSQSSNAVSLGVGMMSVASVVTALLFI